MLNGIKELIIQKEAYQESTNILMESSHGIDLDDCIVLGEEGEQEEMVDEVTEEEDAEADVGEVDTGDSGAVTDDLGSVEEDATADDSEDIMDTEIDDASSDTGVMDMGDTSDDVMDSEISDEPAAQLPGDESPVPPVADGSVGTPTDVQDDINDVLDVEIDLKSNTLSDVLPVPPANAGEAIASDSILPNQHVDSGFGGESDDLMDADIDAPIEGLDTPAAVPDAAEPAEDSIEPDSVMDEEIPMEGEPDPESAVSESMILITNGDISDKTKVALESVLNNFYLEGVTKVGIDDFMASEESECLSIEELREAQDVFNGDIPVTMSLATTTHYEDEIIEEKSAYKEPAKLIKRVCKDLKDDLKASTKKVARKYGFHFNTFTIDVKLGDKNGPFATSFMTAKKLKNRPGRDKDGYAENIFVYPEFSKGSNIRKLEGRSREWVTTCVNETLSDYNNRDETKGLFKLADQNPSQDHATDAYTYTDANGNQKTIYTTKTIWRFKLGINMKKLLGEKDEEEIKESTMDFLNALYEAITLGDPAEGTDDTNANAGGDAAADTAGDPVPEDTGADPGAEGDAGLELGDAVDDKVDEAEDPDMGLDAPADQAGTKESLFKKLSKVTKDIEDAKQEVMDFIQ